MIRIIDRAGRIVANCIIILLIVASILKLLVLHEG